MKKCVILSTVLAGSAIFAMPVLNPAAPELATEGVFYCCPDDCWALRIGFRGDYVFDRKFKDASHTVDRYSLYSNEGTLTLNLWESIDIYGFVGATSQDFTSKYTDAVAIRELVGDYETKTVWGVGLKAILLEWDWTRYSGRSFITAAVDYETVQSANPTTITFNGIPMDVVGSGLTSNRYRETQVSLAWGHQVKKLVPYIAAKWSSARVSTTVVTFSDPFGHDLTYEGMKSCNHWGWALGVTLVDVARMTISAEARFVDESAMTVTGSLRF